MSRQYVQLWSWFNEFGRQARLSRDEQRIRLHQLNNKGFDEREKNPEHALTLYREGAALAETLGEPCMVIFYEHWVASMLIFYLDRCEEGLALATKLVAKVSHESYINCPVRARVYTTLVAAYLDMDTLSYIDEIRAMIDTLDHHIPLDEDTHQRLYAYRAHLWIEVRDYEKALDDALKYLEISASSSFRMTYAYKRLCLLSYLQNEDRHALDYAYLTGEMAQKADVNSELGNSYFWQALLLVMQGESHEANRLFLRAIAQISTLGLVNEEMLLYGRCRYYDAKSEYEKSLSLWDEQIRLMNPQTPNRQTYFYVFLRRCFVLRRMGRLSDVDLEQTRQAAHRMHKPDRYLPLVDELLDGKTEIPRY